MHRFAGKSLRRISRRSDFGSGVSCISRRSTRTRYLSSSGASKNHNHPQPSSRAGGIESSANVSGTSPLPASFNERYEQSVRLANKQRFQRQPGHEQAVQQPRQHQQRQQRQPQPPPPRRHQRQGGGPDNKRFTSSWHGATAPLRNVGSGGHPPQHNNRRHQVQRQVQQQQDERRPVQLRKPQVSNNASLAGGGGTLKQPIQQQQTTMQPRNTQFAWRQSAQQKPATAKAISGSSSSSTQQPTQQRVTGGSDDKLSSLFDSETKSSSSRRSSHSNVTATLPPKAPTPSPEMSSQMSRQEQDSQQRSTLPLDNKASLRDTLSLSSSTLSTASSNETLASSSSTPKLSSSIPSFSDQRTMGSLSSSASTTTSLLRAALTKSVERSKKKEQDEAVAASAPLDQEDRAAALVRLSRGRVFDSSRLSSNPPSRVLGDESTTPPLFRFSQEQYQQQRQPMGTPAWKRQQQAGSAKQYRQNLKERLAKQHQRQQNERQRQWEKPTIESLERFYETKDEFMARKNREQEEKKQEVAQRRKQLSDTLSDEPRKIDLPPRNVTVMAFSRLLSVKVSAIEDVLRSVLDVQQPDDPQNHELDPDTMELVALELGFDPQRSLEISTEEEEAELLLRRRREQEEEGTAGVEDNPVLAPRPPVVCLMGHVDHGKTTLMDSLRQRSKTGLKASAPGSGKAKKGKDKKAKTAAKGQALVGSVAGTEAGGITQVITAFEVELDSEVGEETSAGTKSVTFLDTPGHAAFRQMRESGSNAADVIVLVIAADDGVSPQTIEILNFYKSIVEGSGGGGISLVVAMTKIDKPGIDVEEAQQRIENELLQEDIVCETITNVESKYGTPAQIIPVSGLTGENVDQLVEALSLQTEVMDLKADPEVPAEGIIMDARVDKGLGVVASGIVRWGSMTRGDYVVSGEHMGKVKAVQNVAGQPIKTRGMPSQPVQIIGFKSAPKAGDPFRCMPTVEEATEWIERRKEQEKASNRAEVDPNQAQPEIQVMGKAIQQEAKMDRFLSKHGLEKEPMESSQIRIPVIVKADADGTLAALRESIVNIGYESTQDIVIDPIVASIGDLTASEVTLARDSGAVVFAFNLKKVGRDVQKLLEENDVDFRRNDVIYRLLEDAKTVFAKHLPLSPVETVHGKAKVQAVFEVDNGKNKIAGLMVTEGTIYKSQNTDLETPVDVGYRVVRDGKVVSDPEDAKRTQPLVATSLRHVKDDVDFIKNGKECGLALEKYTDYEEGDIIECFSVEMKEQFI